MVEQSQHQMQGYGQLRPETLAKIKAQTKKNFDFFEASVTPEQRIQVEDCVKHYKTDPAWIASKMTQLDQDFAACDTNGDGRLDADEHKAFYGRMIERAQAESRYCKTYEGQLDDIYDMYNSIDETHEGYSMADFMICKDVAEKYWFEMKGAR
uniref:EF-hand domain-containing protein n=1 Tax=Favella ehrenbergii TaxID=182087 RepID=A0A7S3I5K6_9SPIT|mmetsp:Transcript_37854/g.46075  ORF Transcript_37854/g.46075 Transcript_37854/m.46075 type:complete len:153 (+) Transcript_37854:40-498(+)|eukprot:CAMPEP_0170465202 /NCGR_PEP_ID=MMETSP0123-20130129/9631_1 /TAXON_ID=182087 /ORGANISM="Favella ehrenbergii, Strain Fehren 1" /LENGTH=152 /DNA_ID=CAMNT_0010731033 /DNA_START=21 /DNA_END=479 /DNA_ORIENTATION=+